MNMEEVREAMELTMEMDKSPQLRLEVAREYVRLRKQEQRVDEFSAGLLAYWKRERCLLLHPVQPPN
jgi:hypothetical protein